MRSSSGLGCHPFTVVTWIRIPYALQLLFSNISYLNLLFQKIFCTFVRYKKIIFMNKYEKETLENLIFDQNLTYEKIGEIYEKY